MSRRLVVCCDGTWNTPVDHTNVRKLHDRLATTDVQVPKYFTGVGTEGTRVRRLIDGSFGIGLSEHVREVYRWVAETWVPGDELVLIGFSRGAFTVRSVVGMLAQCGLVRFAPEATGSEREALVERLFVEGYRARGEVRDVAYQPGFGPDDLAPIAFLGVWETVGALGVPRTFGLLSGLVGRDDIAFHDLALAPDVRHARQALALDEARGPYVPSIWRSPPPGRHASFAQLWFPGAHSDVGGGAETAALSDGALRWMIDEATTAVGLTWRDDAPPLPTGDPLGRFDDPVTGAWRYLSPRPRTVPRVAEGTADVHRSALARRAGLPGYRPGRVLAPGEEAVLTVPAGEPWPGTELYLDPGTYRATATGRWTDHGAASPPTGASRWPPASWAAYGVGTALNGVRRLVERVTGNPRSDIVGSARVPEARWLELVVAVADDVIDLDGTVHEGTTVPIGPTGTREITVPRGGYLYAFANDAWTGYGSNGGAATLTVTRLD